MNKNETDKLQKSLRLFDVYAISTGAMFSSGFFLLPGIAASLTGPSVIFAYLVASVCIIPAMFSIAELATAMPKAGGAYFYLDRSMGPLMGTIGGLGSWIALVLKSAFALIGLAAYINLYIEIPVIEVSLILTLAFGIINLVGAKETAGLQRMLVIALVTIMFYFIVEGFFSLNDAMRSTPGAFSIWFTHGFTGFASTVGLVFVSYAGLTKVTSVAEEIVKPERNIPLGMIMALVSTAFIYGAGIYMMVYFVPPEVLYSDLTPVITTAKIINNWLPETIMLALMSVAAVAAFASTGNAGIMAASRYLYAMSKDKLISRSLSRLNRRRTPSKAIFLTIAVMGGIMLILNIENIAKLASAFQLLLFGLFCVAVIIMRESGIKSYDPGFKSPFYPWTQITGIFISSWLILEMGVVSIIFIVVVSLLSMVWYLLYGAKRVSRLGAIYHVHARLGQKKYSSLEDELRTIMSEQELRVKDPYEKMISQATFLDYPEIQSQKDLFGLFDRIAHIWSTTLKCPQEQIYKALINCDSERKVRLSNTVLLIHITDSNTTMPLMTIVRNKEGYRLDNSDHGIHATFFIVHNPDNPGLHVRMLGQLATHIDADNFLDKWLAAKDQLEIKEILLRDDHYLVVDVLNTKRSSELIGKKLMEINFPGDALVALIHRGGQWVIPRGQTIIYERDQLSIIGNPSDVKQLEMYLEDIPL